LTSESILNFFSIYKYHDLPLGIVLDHGS
jgi:hypothetical protein